MRIDSAILSNAIITASVENPIVSGSSQVNITNTTGYSTFSSSIQTYTDAKVAGLVDSAPGTLNTLNELAAALGDDANMSASFATTLGTKLPTATHTAFSSSNASALRTEYSGADTTLSASAHTQRAAIDAKIAALDSTYATDASVSSLSASAHTRREEISASLDATIDALDSLGISTDTERGALSSSAHTQREAIKGLATTANNSLSSSTAAALRTEYVAGDSALSASAHTRRNELHALQLLSSSVGATINDNAVKLSGIESGATADQSNAEIRAAVEAASDSNVFTDADHSKLNAIEASADVTDATNVAAAGALMSSSLGGTINDNVVKLAGIEAGATADQTDEEIQDIVGAMVTGNTESGITVTYQDGDGTIDFSVASQTDENFTTADHAKLDGIEAGADVTDTANVTAAGALMDSELTSIADVKALDQSVISGADPTFGTANMTDATNKRFMTDAQETKLDSVESNADVTDTTNVVAALTAGANITISAGGEISSTDTDTNTFRTVTAGGNTLGGSETLAFAAGSNVTITESGGTVTIASTDTNTNTFRTVVAGGNTLGGSETLTFAAGSNVSISESGGTVTIASTDTNTDTVDMGDGFKIASSDGTDQFTVTENEEIRFAGSGATSVSFDASTQKVTISSTDNNTEYSVGDGGLTQNNFTDALKTKLDGIAASATNVTNNNQISNGAGYTTYTANQTLDNNDNVHFEGLMVGQTTGATANTIRCVGDIVAYYSDDRLKNKIGNLEDALSKVNSLNGFTYTPNEAALALGVDQDEVRVGVSAQEVQAVLPEAVKDAPVQNTEGYLTVQYEKIVPLLVEAIKELSAKVEELSK